MKKYRGKGRRNFDPSADGRYMTTICNIMARNDADRKGGGPRYQLLHACSFYIKGTSNSLALRASST
jgi:hypothetical protein